MRDEFSELDSAGSMRKIRVRERGDESGSSWRLEPHVCRTCFARIASTPHADGRLYQCTNCGLEAVSGKVSSVCACGLKMRKGGKHGTTGAMVDLGIRCHLNSARSAEFPALYTASYAAAQEDA